MVAVQPPFLVACASRHVRCFPMGPEEATMKMDRLALAGVLVLVGAGCARDHAKEAESAQAELTKAQQQARAEEARMQERHAREQTEAQQKPMSSGERAELERKQREEAART